jgi:hypothetical protein
MLWEGRQLRDIAEDDLRQIIASGLAEHLQLEYKSELYQNNDRGNREVLLDICMFANAEGGVLLIGIPELRDSQGQPTGMPDPAGPIGLNLVNPEAILQSLDARVTAAIEERLSLESAAIRLANGSHVMAFRIQNDTAKPHCVRYQGHVYFPSRRERSRYDMDVRVIKELVMRTASRLDLSRQMLKDVFLATPRPADPPYLHIAIVSIFGKEFVVNLRIANIRHAVGMFDVLNENPQMGNVTYGFNGLERQTDINGGAVEVRRNGLVNFRRPLPMLDRQGPIPNRFFPTAIDLQLRKFMFRASTFYSAAEISGPYLLSMMLHTSEPLAGMYAAPHGIGAEPSRPIAPGDYQFPPVLMDDFANVDEKIRPLCDQAHQTFGRASSLCFGLDGTWVGIR